MDEKMRGICEVMQGITYMAGTKLSAGGEKEVNAIKSKKKKKNNIVILINAENKEELKAIKEEFLLSARRAARKRELGFYITSVEQALGSIKNWDALEDLFNIHQRKLRGNQEELISGNMYKR